MAAVAALRQGAQLMESNEDSEKESSDVYYSYSRNKPKYQEIDIDEEK